MESMIRLVLGLHGRLASLSVLLCVCCASAQEPLIQEPAARSKASSASVDEAQPYSHLLQFIRIPESRLPKHVQMVGAVRTAPLIPVTRNPQVLVDPERIQPIAMHFGLSGKPDLESVRAGVVALYQENDPANEIGVYGIYFSNEKSAAQHFEKLVGAFKKRAKDKAGFPFLQKGRLLLYVWKDDGVSKRALESVQAYFKDAKLKPARTS